MRLEDFNYDLPSELIAQEPLSKREQSRLLVLDKKTGTISHRTFSELGEFLQPGDLLVSNNTRVIPARLYGRKEKTGALIEVLLLTRQEGRTWETLARPGKRVQPGTRIIFGEGELVAEAIEKTPSGGRIMEFQFEGVFEEILDCLGQMPLPPYIHKDLEDKERYQTVYARTPGSAAAPTAGLHFTPEMIDSLKAKGIQWVEILLHVGLGTFRPVKEEDITKHQMHSEYYEISPQGAATINKALAKGRRIIAVGTTSTRALESSWAGGQVQGQKGWTDIFIYPGYEFKVISGLITNFHLPKSTLLMLVSALAGREKVLQAYQEAVANKYRFFSFGDAMLII